MQRNIVLWRRSIFFLW